VQRGGETPRGRVVFDDPRVAGDTTYLDTAVSEADCRKLAAAFTRLGDKLAKPPADAGATTAVFTLRVTGYDKDQAREIINTMAAGGGYPPHVFGHPLDMGRLSLTVTVDGQPYDPDAPADDDDADEGGAS
jgi:hypothetical protein